MKVIIVGCGLAGLSLALALVSKKKKDVDVSIIEKRPDFESRGATFGLAPNGQIALQEICPSVLAYLKEIGIIIPQSGAFMLPWWEVRDALLAEARKHPDQITIHLGLSLDAIEETDDDVTVTFHDSDLALKGSFLIGADGVHSYTRTQVLQLPPAVPTGAHVWRGRLNVKEIPELHHLVDNPVGQLNYFGKTVVAYFNFNESLPGTIAWVVSSKAGPIVPEVTTPVDLVNQHVESAEDKDDDELIQNAKFAKLVFSNTESNNDLTFSTEMSTTPLDSGWAGKGRITLIGDAAHALRPASGLGGSLAFEDSVLLARMLTSSEGGDGGAETLRKFEERRLPRCKSISDDQTMRSELSYKKEVKIPEWSQQYREWIFMGPDAPSHPPEEES